MLQSFRRNEAILAEKLAIMFWTNILAILSLPLKIILSVSHNFKICWVAINIRVTATSEPSLSFPFLLPTMRAISEHTKNNIISALHQGLSTRKVAERCGVSDFTVRKVRKESILWPSDFSLASKQETLRSSCDIRKTKDGQRGSKAP